MLNGIKSFSYPYHLFLEEAGLKLENPGLSLDQIKHIKKSSTIMQLDQEVPLVNELHKGQT